VKYAVDANLFPTRVHHSLKKFPAPGGYLVGGEAPDPKKKKKKFSKNFEYI